MSAVNEVNLMRTFSSGLVGFFSDKILRIPQSYLSQTIRGSISFPTGIAVIANLISAWTIQRTGILTEKNVFKREAGCLAITVITTVALSVLASCFGGAALGSIIISSSLLGVALRITSLVTENLYSFLVISPRLTALKESLLYLKGKVKYDQGLHLGKCHPSETYYPRLVLEVFKGKDNELHSNCLFFTRGLESNKKFIKAEYIAQKKAVRNPICGYSVRNPIYGDTETEVIWSCPNILEDEVAFGGLKEKVDSFFQKGLDHFPNFYISLSSLIKEQANLLNSFSTSVTSMNKLRVLNLQVETIIDKTNDMIACWAVVFGARYNNFISGEPGKKILSNIEDWKEWLK